MYKNRKTTGILVFVDITESLSSLKDTILQFAGAREKPHSLWEAVGELNRLGSAEKLLDITNSLEDSYRQNQIPSNSVTQSLQAHFATRPLKLANILLNNVKVSCQKGESLLIQESICRNINHIIAKYVQTSLAKFKHSISILVKAPGIGCVFIVLIISNCPCLCLNILRIVKQCRCISCAVMQKYTRTSITTWIFCATQFNLFWFPDSE